MKGLSPLLLLLNILTLDKVVSQLGPCDRTRRVLTAPRGVLSTGPIGANYTQDSHCEWLIKSNSSTERFISLTFRSMGTECAYDYVFVYDGSSFNAPLLGSFSGRTAPPRVTAASGSMLLLLYSDTNYVLDGFRAEYTISACPGNCTGRGYCLKGRCICNDAQWGGPDCSRKLCPNECGKKERHGQCDKGHCICRSGYSGRSCSLPEKSPSDGRWHYLAQTGEGLRPRAAHSAVYVGITDALYVFGGYDLNHVLADLEVYNFQTNSWRDSNGNELIDWELVDRVDPAEAARFIAQQSLEGLGLPQNSLVSNIFYALGDNSSKFLRRQRHSGGLAEEVVVGPRGRYGHSGCAAANGFVLYGGKLKDGNLSDQLWYYDVQTRLWHLRAQFSVDRPPKLTRHTLTCVNNTIYLFGGSTPDGEFSSQLWQIKLHSDFTEQWAEVHARGGKPLDIRVVAHTTVHHRATNSLIVYGGIAAGVARFSKLSDKMFAFQLDNKHWTEIHYTREHLREKFVPRERAFHSANVFGNYLVIFGGYSHRHNKEEICYDNQMYLYHLGCHTWVNPDILGSHNESRYPKQQGVFAHASSVRNDHTLVIVGGYHGNVNGDLLAWTAPPALRSIPPSACSLHVSFGACSADPECGWCSADDRCYGRTVGANCTTNLQTARCPGVCPALQDCHSCLVHGHLHGTEESSSSSASYRLGLGECAWCVQNARCHPKDDPHGAGACGAQEDSPSQIPGWWGPKGTEIRQPQDCAALDHRPGLTFIKYNHPANFSQPDHVTTLNATTIDFNGAAFLPARIDGLGGQVVANLLGFLRLPIGWRETLNICASHSVTTVTLADTLVCNITTVERNCTSRPWPEDLPEGRIPINYQSVKTVGQLYTPHQQSRMELQHSKPEETPKVFTFEYLEPFANGTCSQYTNCLHCLTDSQCGWCELTNTCRSRTDDEQETCALDGDWRYLTIQPGMCPNCSNFISCTSCVATGICEWWIEEARCTRMGQKPGSVIEASECPTPCYMRSGCDSCLDQRGRCVWCQATQKCFSFSVYTSEYQFGLCREWLDQAFPLITTHENSSLAPKSQEQCKACAAHTNCSACLGALSCGWCHDASNPMSGMCVRGDFQRPETSCSEVLGGKEAKWAYAQCPDVDECGLGLHDCHPQADCINTDGSFSCHCRKGYIGDGRSSCVRTCYNVCVHGSCQGEPEYKCSCDVGWYGDDCSRNCGCNNHSACPEGYQICDQCQDHTMGKYCEYCRPGSFGNATTEQGCRPCECNGHGDSDKGECDIETGECFCQDNTEGLHCERCKPNYSGDPRNGQQCYYQCEARGVLTEPKGQGISSLQNLNPPHGGPPIGECLWIIKPDVDYGTPIIQLQINSTQLNVTCGENAVYVYDGLPELVDMGSQSALSAVFCTQEALPTAIVESRTGHLTVHYKQGPPNESFSAVYKVISCDACESPRECRDGKCVCQEGFVGPNCYEEICPRNCSSAAGRGSCDANYGRCLCNEGWTGQDCSIAETKLQLVFIELFNTERLAVGLDHLRKTLPRFGHSLVSDRRGSLWMFGGYSLSHGPLNDVRLFDTKNISWIQVTVESTPDARMPQGRYFHGADIVHSKQAIFVYGGLTKPQKNLNNRTLNDFWQFDIPNQRWDEIESPYANVKLPSAYWVTDWPPALYGHTLTYYRNADRDESLILIGGDSPNHGFLNVIWEYSIDKNVWTKIMSKGNGPAGIFGHSTVFHSQTNSLYVFGGYVYEKQMSVMSNSLYRLEYETKTWIELTGGNSGYVPKPRFFHSAVTTDHYMLILGGRIYPWNISDTLYAFSYNCNQWINLMTESVEKIGPHPKQTYAQAMTIEPDGDAAYVIGGWDIDTHTSVLKIELPMDICNLFSTKTTCLRVPGCGYCANKNGDDIVTQICHRNTLDCPLDSTGNTVRISNSGRICEGQYIGGNCSSIKDCGTCSLSPGCVFCNGTDTCVNSIDTECASQICPFRKCVATDCVQCHQLERCEWSYSRRICERTNTTHEAHVIGQCPASCSTYQSCSDCLKIHGCHWSTRLHECLNSASQSVYCAGGTCGLVLESNDPKQCPEPCNAFDQCSSCLRHGNCGWCAAPGDSGKGMCSEGNSERPMKGDCSKVVEEMGSLLEDFVDDQNYTWHYVTCPKENECANGHHSCANGSEICVDLDYGYKCVCGEGYKLGSTGCEPVCPQGCVRGRCVAPSKCECEFGYVGANCSIQCLCHGHSNCEGPDKLDHCIKCHNNTKGDRCEFCEPFFVGDPTNRTACVPCSEYCHGHSNYCVDANSTFSIQRNDYVDVEVLLETLHVGPKGDAVCLRCTDKTTGNRCDECITGNFRGSDVLGDPCRSCDCHGHGTKCHPVTGDQCDCQNNTVSDECSGQGRNSAQPSCWEVQCAKCREGFLGTPTNGRQCYKQMSVDNKMCFNAKPIDECKMPRPLQPGELVFFVIQPRFMNVDIRIVVDVTQGALNVFMSTHDDTYVARPNTTTGINDIELDEIYRPFENGSHRSEDMHIKTEAVGLRTYITVTQPKTILTVRNLTSRLVITLPEEYHKLENTRFFLVLQSIDEHQPAYGVVFSRQDQLHIDLFVFFSVFFSVFFLFLAACVVAWKAKQAADARHARRRHVVEMLHMAKRPFAGVTLDLTTKTPTGKRNAHHEVRPVAIEPTGDNVAAVATVFVSLPGGQNLPVKLALASSLILLARQFPTSSRMFLRRRSIHAAPPT